MLLRSQIVKIRDVDDVVDYDVTELIYFSTTVKNMTALFQAAEMEVRLSTPRLLEELVIKLSKTRGMESAHLHGRLSTKPDDSGL